jgi:Fe-S-cluster containining protein
MMKAFECKLCGSCCYGKGGIFVDKDETENIAGFLQILPEAFLGRFCEKRSGRFSIKTAPDGFCIFYNKQKSCLIHPVKPRPCALWPYYPAILKDAENWEIAKDACPGINSDCSFEDFVGQSKK